MILKHNNILIDHSFSTASVEKRLARRRQHLRQHVGHHGEARGQPGEPRGRAHGHAHRREAQDGGFAARDVAQNSG